MAEKRMFNKTLMFSDQFTQLPKSAQLLYFYLNLQADDDGICGNARAVCRVCGCSKTHMQMLVDGGWVLQFEEGEVAIAHWLIHNQIRKNRYKPSIHTRVTERLQKAEDGVYVLVEPGCHLADQWSTQERIDKESKEKNSIDKDRQEEDSKEAAPAEPAESSSKPPPAADDYDIDKDLNLDIDYDRILYYYQLLCKDLVPCEKLTPKLRQMIADRFREGYTQLRLLSVFQSAMMSDFLAGKTDARGWRANMEWLLDPMHIRDVENGKYTTWH